MPDTVRDKALQFLGMAYLEGYEELVPGGLLYELVSKLRAKELGQLCWFFWTLRGEAEVPERAQKVLYFWALVDEQLRLQDLELPELRSGLSQLTVFVKDLTGANLDLVVAAAPYAQVRFHGYMLLQNVNRLGLGLPQGGGEGLSRGAHGLCARVSSRRGRRHRHEDCGSWGAR